MVAVTVRWVIRTKFLQFQIHTMQQSWTSNNLFFFIFPRKFTFSRKSLSLSLPNDQTQIMPTFWPHLFFFFVSISSLLRQSSFSYAASASSIINPAKAKQVSWKPRSLSLSLSLTNHSLIVLISWNQLSQNRWIRWFFLLLCRAFVYEGFLTELECDHLISLVSYHLKFYQFSFLWTRIWLD